MKRFTKDNFVTALQIMGLIILFGYSVISPNAESKENSPDKTSMDSEPTVELKTNMRNLWKDHVTWTRNVILCLVDELPGYEPAVKRLLQNQVDIGNAIKPYYGEKAGNKLTELLYAHINILAEAVKAAKTDNTTALTEANKRWYANTDELSEFLSKLNPNWNLALMKMMMMKQLNLTSDQVVQRIQKDYDADVIAYDKVQNEILKMSDMLADGIIIQFPVKFKTAGTKTASN